MIRRFFYLRLLRISLVAGALYDATVAAILVLAPQALSRLLALPLPGAAFYLWLLAVLLLMLAILYLAAAHDPRRYSAIIAVAIFGRLLAGACFLLAAWMRVDLGGLCWLAICDFLFAMAHGAFWWPLRR